MSVKFLLCSQIHVESDSEKEIPLINVDKVVDEEKVPLVDEEKVNEEIMIVSNEYELECHDKGVFWKIICLIIIIVHNTFVACWIRDVCTLIIAIISYISCILTLVGLNYNANNWLINISLCLSMVTYATDVISIISYMSLLYDYYFSDCMAGALLILCILLYPIHFFTIKTKYKYTWYVVFAGLLIGIMSEIASVVITPPIFLTTANYNGNLTSVKCFESRQGNEFPFMRLASKNWKVYSCEDGEVKSSGDVCAYVSSGGYLYGQINYYHTPLELKVKCGGIWRDLPAIKIADKRKNETCP